MSGIKRQADVPPETLKPATNNPNDVMQFMPIGSGSEVGRSCHILKYKGKTVMLDCGVHPAYSGLAALPYFDEIDPSEIDLLLISHFHLDHCASLPYFMEKTGFKGRVFMTHPTKAIYKWMLSDYVRVSNVSTDENLYNEQDLTRSYEKIETVDFHQEVEVEGVRFTSYNAGHVLGAAMFLIEIAGVKVLYTGDYSREEDRHLMAAEKPDTHPDVLICESTYGVQNHTPRAERESRFTSLVHNTVARGGRCLIPIFALGRAQELLLILDEYWQAHPELHNIPIYYASNLARKCMAVYQTYINMMNDRIKKQFKVSNPFVFKHISNLKSIEHFDDVGPCVMMASPAMLQSGLSRELFELWCTDKRNGVIIPGYVVEGTLGKMILSEPTEITSLSGAKLPLRCSVDYISFSAHVDYAQNSEFIDLVKPNHLVLVHGEYHMMNRLRQALQRKFTEREDLTKIYTPKNAETVTLYFRGEKMAKTIGAIAMKPPYQDQPINGILLSKDYQYHILDPSELHTYTELKTTKIHQRTYVPFGHGGGKWELVGWHLEMVFPGNVDKIHRDPSFSSMSAINDNFDIGLRADVSKENKRGLNVCDVVKVWETDKKELILEWEGGAMNDMIADSVLAVLLQIEWAPVSVKLTTHSHSHDHHHDAPSSSTEPELEKDVSDEEEEDYLELLRTELPELFKSHFDSVQVINIESEGTESKEETEPKDKDTGTIKSHIKIEVDDIVVTVCLKTLAVESPNPNLSRRVKNLLDRCIRMLLPFQSVQDFIDGHVRTSTPKEGNIKENAEIDGDNDKMDSRSDGVDSGAEEKELNEPDNPDMEDETKMTAADDVDELTSP